MIWELEDGTTDVQKALIWDMEDRNSDVFLNSYDLGSGYQEY